VIGATLTPFKGWTAWTPTLETTRTAVNTGFAPAARTTRWSTSTPRSATPPIRWPLLPAFDSGDHLHPKDGGYPGDGQTRST